MSGLSLFSGRTNTLPQSTSYGYLSDSNFGFVLTIIKKQRRIEISLMKKRTKKIVKYLKRTTRMKSLFYSYLNCIDKIRDIKCNRDDSLKMVAYHSLGYQSKIDAVINKYTRLSVIMKKYNETYKIYYPGLSRQLKMLKNELDEIEIEYDEFKKDLGILRKCLGFFQSIYIMHACR